MTTTSENAVQTAAPELVITRVFEAPRALVWRAWTEDEHMSHWGAPHGFIVTHCEGVLRVGGTWRSCMKSPDGQELWLGGEYREVVPIEKLVFTHIWDDENGQPGPETVVTITLADEGRSTKMVFRQTGFTSASSRDGHEGGWNESFDRLREYLPGMHTEGRDK